MQTKESLVSEIRNEFLAAQPRERLSIFRRAIVLCKSAMPAANDEIVDLFDELIGQFATRMDFDALLELSEALSTLERAPRGILNSLAEGQYTLARPILERSPAIDEAVLIRIANKGDDNCLHSMAKRAQVSVRLSDIIVTKGGRATLLTISRNEGALFSSYGIELLVTKSESDRTLQMILTRRSDLSPKANERLAVLAEIRMAEVMARPAATLARPTPYVVPQQSSKLTGLEELRQHLARRQAEKPKN